ncbi:MAG: PAC2 family protein [Thaumarchaeota archaeon]|nr:PAC2 family protein [Nitrososphaerota archaeon]
MWEHTDYEKGLRLRKPVLIVSISTSILQYRTLYSQGRELADYMLRKMRFDLVGSTYSSSLPPEVITRDDGTVSLPACRMYRNKGDRDLLLLAGDSSPLDDQYQFAHRILALAAEVGVEELYSVGARWTDAPLQPADNPDLWGFATDMEGVAELKKQGVKIMSNEPAPFFASLVVGLCGSHGIRGFKVSVNHGEPAPHPLSVRSILGVLSAMIGFEIDRGDLGAKTTIPPASPGADLSSIYH